MNLNVPEQFSVNFQTSSSKFTPNGYTKDIIIDKLAEFVSDNEYRNANYLVAELFCSKNGYKDVWNFFFNYYFAFINTNCPQFMRYLYQKYQLFVNIRKLYVSNKNDMLCNNQELRNHFSEIVSIMCSLPKTPELNIGNVDRYKEDIERFKLNRLIDFKVFHHMGTNILPNSDLHSNISIFINTMNYHKRHGVDLRMALPAIQWFMEDSNFTINENTFSECKLISKSLRKNSIWLIWKFLYMKIKHDSDKLNIFMEYLELFLLIYKVRKNGKRMVSTGRNLIYQACMFILSELNWSDVRYTIQTTNRDVLNCIANINFVYRDIGKDLQSSSTSTSTSSSMKRRNDNDTDNSDDNGNNMDNDDMNNKSDGKGVCSPTFVPNIMTSFPNALKDNNLNGNAIAKDDKKGKEKKLPKMTQKEMELKKFYEDENILEFLKALNEI